MTLVAKILWQLEQHLYRPLTVDDLSRRCAVSPYHLSRAFRAGTGQSPMGYLRARRLSAAAATLAFGQQDILTTALEAGYNSHEAFTRAFTAAFGCTPRSIRAAGSLSSLTLTEPLTMTVNTPIALAPPEVRHHDARTLAGYSIACSHDQIADIPALWSRFNANCDTPDLDQSAAYGVSYNVTPDGKFDYMAGCALAGEDVPEGMTSLHIPAGTYATFKHDGHVSDMPAMFNAIWNDAIPAAGLKPRAAPEYEVYDETFNGQTGRGILTVAIPVE
ncbi:AraC family transcriptional regulator [Pseudooctadecabacter jejudonensis]|uniref:Right origin-binding protein n=1 Tax=Pseudooctadecabacter jejudonensis TaxID=1391910 RepID=A0A1Y5S2F0_9RHOB|nr:AraC family transcriptional regulator [Pseudooctadecabacter jejudonensis]SLN29713.1 Right origin-binding protein [Pseudooctadecabacter jejudonensis]